MPTITHSRREAKYLACRTLLDAGFSHDQVGRAMQALESDPASGPEPEIEPDPEPKPYEPTEQDFREYEDYLERLQYERGCDAWVIRPV